MAQKAIEIILMRQLAGYLAMPMLLFDPHGNLLYYNPPAEALLGHRFEESGILTRAQWNPLLDALGADGTPVALSERPLVKALASQHPANASFWLQCADGVRRHVETTAIPLIGQGGRHLGAAVIFWEHPES